jgi:peptidoglycan-associated lipoprotein
MMKQFLTGILSLSLFLMYGCASAPTVDEVEKTAPQNNSSIEEGSNENASDESVAIKDSDHNKAMGLKTVFFAFDSFNLDVDAKSVLDENAKLLIDNPKWKIQIEGHCDQRGGIQYNLALGEKRANALKKYLFNQGIEKDRISIITYGKEKLLDSDFTEDAHSKNRRGNFILLEE